MKNRPPPLRSQTKHTDILLPEKTGGRVTIETRSILPEFSRN